MEFPGDYSSPSVAFFAAIRFPRAAMTLSGKSLLFPAFWVAGVPVCGRINIKRYMHGHL